MANIITSCRILCGVALLFVPTFSFVFYFLYLLAGVTDMVDGTVARKSHSVSEFGSKLDTVADGIFVAACFIKLISVIDIPIWLWIWIGIIMLIKMRNVVLGFISQKKFVAGHTFMNKVTGFLLFLLPLTLSMIDLRDSAIVICIIATFAAMQERHDLKTGKMR